MRLSGWIGLGLGLFYLVAGIGYALTSEFVNGFPLLIAAGIGISVLGGYAYLAVRRAERALASGSAAQEPTEPHVGATIWPFGYALSAVGFVLGFHAYRPMYAVGGLLFLAATAGWFADVRQQWSHNNDEDGELDEPVQPGDRPKGSGNPLVDEGIQ